MDESSHTSTLAFTRSFPAVVQGTGAIINVALQLLSEPPIPGTWEEAVAVCKKGKSLPALLVPAVVCACPQGLPTLCASRAVHSCHTAQYGQGGNAWPCTEERSLHLLTLSEPPCTPVLQ